MSKLLKINPNPNITWEEALEQFLWFKKAQGLREITIRGHKDVIKLFFKRHTASWLNDPKPFIYSFMSEDIKAATYNIRLSYLKSFFDWCINEGFYTSNPLISFKRRKAEGRIVNIDIEVLKRLLLLPDKKTFAGYRDYTLLLLTLDTGIRPKEAFSLLIDDINLRSLEIYIRSEVSKTKISRTLPISIVTANSIRELINYRHPLWKDNTPIICTAEGTFLNRHTWGDRLELYSKGLGVKIRPYDLRHAFALQFLRNGGHALALQRTLGHTDLSMTKRYVALTENDIREQHSIASPIFNLVKQKKTVRKLY